MSAQNGNVKNLNLFPMPGGSEGSDPQASDIGEHEDDSGKPMTLDASKAEGKIKPRAPRKRVERNFPAAPFEEALELARGIQDYGAGRKIRRLTLFHNLGKAPDSGRSRQLVTNSVRYGLTVGGYSAESLELTADGNLATADNIPEREKLKVWFKLAIEQVAPFKALHDAYTGARVPAKAVMVDFVREHGVGENEASECVDTFLLNAKFVGIIKTLSGAERIVSIDHVLDYAPAGVQSAPAIAPTVNTGARRVPVQPEASSAGAAASDTDDDRWNRICFYITPIGHDDSEHRQHSDLFLGQIIEPAMEEFDLEVVRADKIAEPGMITKQVIEHVMEARLVIADLSYHNPNVFYELALRHASGKPVVQITRKADPIPFDVKEMRTIVIDNTDIYSLIPQLSSYRALITTQVRRALENPGGMDNPVTAFYQVKPPVRTQVD